MVSATSTSDCSSPTTNPPSLTSTQWDLALKKLKRFFKPVEPSLGIIGFSLLVFSLFIFCFSRFGRETGPSGQWLYRRGASSSWLGGLVAAPPRKSGSRVGFLDEGGDGCDVFDGNWVWDDGYPLYKSKDCAFIDGGFRCLENGRPDNFFTKWRWQPTHCNLPRFEGRLMLENLRNKRLVFVGDSIGRNQWESFLCLLAPGVPANSSSIYEVNGNPITKHTGSLAFMFKEYNCTVEYYRSPFLVYQGRPPARAPKGVKMTLRVDKMDWTSSKWQDADVLIFNSGHWWNYDKTIKVGCYFQEAEKIKMEMSVEEAYRRSIETLMEWIRRKVNAKKTQVFFRTYAPVHFRGGDWRTGGTCHLEKFPDLTSSADSSDNFLEPLLNVLSQQHSSNGSSHATEMMSVLNVTHLSAKRKDGHASLFYLGPGVGPASIHRQDCSHWCLPGVPDSWNELLYAIMMKRWALHSQKNSSQFSQAPV